MKIVQTSQFISVATLYKIAQNLTIEVAPNLSQIPLMIDSGQVIQMGDRKDIENITRAAIKAYFTRVDSTGDKFFGNRYKTIVTNIDDRESQWLTISVTFALNYNKPGMTDMASPDSPRYEYHKQRNGGRTGRTNYKTPKDAIAEIPVDPNFAYRGIAWEEWQSIRQKGYIQSRGAYNIGQEGYTLFGMKPNTALAYAHGFAPMQYQVGSRRPGVIIAIDKSHLLTHQQDPENVPSGELGLKGKLPMTEIKQAWMVVPTQSKNDSSLDLRIPWARDKKEPQSWKYSLDPTRTGAGSASLGVITSYAIRPMF